MNTINNFALMNVILYNKLYYFFLSALLQQYKDNRHKSQSLKCVYYKYKLKHIQYFPEYCSFNSNKHRVLYSYVPCEHLTLFEMTKVSVITFRY